MNSPSLHVARSGRGNLVERFQPQIVGSIGGLVKNYLNGWVDNTGRLIFVSQVPQAGGGQRLFLSIVWLSKLHEFILICKESLINK